VADFHLSAGDTKPPFHAQLQDADGNPVDISGASVRFVMRAIRGTAPFVAANAVIDGADAGLVHYDWQDGDTDEAGGYYADWEVMFISGDIAAFPNDGPMTVAIHDDLEAEEMVGS
jgi:hypothetical protein